MPGGTVLGQNHQHDYSVGICGLKILVLSFYFTPDLCAGAFRAEALVQALVQRFPEAQIDVVSTQPNRYQSYFSEAPVFEASQGLTITRVALPSHRSGMIDQSRAFFCYVRACLRATNNRHYDLVIGTSSRLMTAALAAWVARLRGAILYLDVRDIFVDTIGEVLQPTLAGMTKPFFSLLEKWTFRRADKINLVSRGFESYFQERYPSKPLSFFTNGIDVEFLRPLPPPAQPAAEGITILYAGNIGEGQGLHHILPELASRMQGRASFRVVGDGGRKEALQQALAARGVDNVELLPPVRRDVLLQEYAAADVLFLHLNDYDAFRKVLPSKIFEYAAVGKPIWAGVGGYAAQFVTEEVDNAKVFSPCNPESAMDSFERLQLITSKRADFLRKFARANIMRELADDMCRLVQEASVR